jgi:hypothetical protein
VAEVFAGVEGRVGGGVWPADDEAVREEVFAVSVGGEVFAAPEGAPDAGELFGGRAEVELAAEVEDLAALVGFEDPCGGVAEEAG